MALCFVVHHVVTCKFANGIVDHLFKGGIQRIQGATTLSFRLLMDHRRVSTPGCLQLRRRYELLPQFEV
jgi:hypothetical protein